MKRILTFVLVVISLGLKAQFHTLTMPKASPYVQETQLLGVTEIAISYHSPAVKGRDIWNRLVPKNGDPLPWRVGANMNTTISFSTDVEVSGEKLKAGSYGLHAIPSDDSWQIILASNDNLWGSYYLDQASDVALTIETKPYESEYFTENLDFEYINRTDSTLELTIEWEKLSIPMPIAVDLNKTVIDQLRYELRGINTYHWQAWNDAARWCLERGTNLEEALEWAERSIRGGYGGFASNKNFVNLTTKADLLRALGKTTEFENTYLEAIPLLEQEWDGYDRAMALLQSGAYKVGLLVAEQTIKVNPENWVHYLVKARGLYWSGESKKAIKTLQSAKKLAPEQAQQFLSDTINKMEKNEKVQ